MSDTNNNNPDVEFVNPGSPDRTLWTFFGDPFRELGRELYRQNMMYCQMTPRDNTVESHPTRSGGYTDILSGRNQGKPDYAMMAKPRQLLLSIEKGDTNKFRELIHDPAIGPNYTFDSTSAAPLHYIPEVMPSPRDKTLVFHVVESMHGRNLLPILIRHKEFRLPPFRPNGGPNDGDPDCAFFFLFHYMRTDLFSLEMLLKSHKVDVRSARHCLRKYPNKKRGDMQGILRDYLLDRAFWETVCLCSFMRELNTEYKTQMNYCGDVVRLVLEWIWTPAVVPKKPFFADRIYSLILEKRPTGKLVKRIDGWR